MLRRPRFSAVLVALLAVAACRDQTQSALSTDSALARDLTLAGSEPAVQPALQDEPAPTSTSERPAPRATEPRPDKRARTPEPRPPRPAPERPAPTPVERPAPAPSAEAPAPAPAPAPRTGTIASGTSMSLVTDSRACSDGSRPGDKMVARLAEGVTGTNGVSFPAGSIAVVEIASVQPSANADSAQLTFRVKSITVGDVTHPVTGDVIPTGTLERHRVETGSSDKKKVIGGAIAGAVLGQVLGKGAKGAVIGAATGAAAGAAVAHASARYEACLPAGATLRLTLTQPVEMPL